MAKAEPPKIFYHFVWLKGAIMAKAETPLNFSPYLSLSFSTWWPVMALQFWLYSPFPGGLALFNFF